MKITSLVKRVNRKFYPQKLYYAPRWLVLGVNNICNLHCKMCDVGVDFNESNFFQNLMGSKPINMPVELIRRIIDQSATFFPTTKLGYAFTEPLIYPHLMESLDYANSKGIYTSITTNALNLKRFSDGLLAAGLNDLFISLDGPPEIHNFIRGHKSSFQKAIQGIEYLLAKENPPGISIYCVITEWNIGHLQEFLDYFKKYPIKEIGFMHTVYTPENVAAEHNLLYGSDYPATASNMEQINLDRMDLKVLAEEIKAIRNTDYPFNVVFSPELNGKEELDVFYHHPELFIGKRCTDIFNDIMIKSNGDVIPAHGRCFNLTIGNMYETDLKQIWNSDTVATFRNTVSKAGGLLPACARCCSAFK